MRQKNPSGYPLPAGELGGDEIVCQLVYLPDRPEYWQALYAALAYFATWRAWERDTDKRGKDAASDWRESLELTTECWRMACLEGIQDTIDEILLEIRNKTACCDENIVYITPPPITTDIDPGVGDPPEFYGETEVADWDEWYEYVCYNAHKYVDYLVSVSGTLKENALIGSWTIGLIAAALTLLAMSGIGLPIAFTLAAGIVSSMVLLATFTTFDDSANQLEAAREQIVCAIMHGYSLPDAVEDALGSDTAWDAFFKHIPYDEAVALIIEGGQDSEFLPAEKKDDCIDCYPPFDDEDIEVYIHPNYGTNLQYANGVWTADGQLNGPCYQLWLEFYTDVSKTVWKAARMQYLSCSGLTPKCYIGTDEHQGSDQGGPVFVINHPTLPQPSDGAVETEYVTHGEPFSVSFRLYDE